MRASVASLPEADSPVGGAGGPIRVRVRTTCPGGPLVNVSQLPTNGLAAPSPLGAARRVMREVLTACLDLNAAVSKVSGTEGFDTQVNITYFEYSVKTTDVTV